MEFQRLSESRYDAGHGRLPPWGYAAVALATLLSSALAAEPAVGPDSLQDAIATINAVGLEGQGQAVASRAWLQLSKLDADCLVPILGGMVDTKVQACNWLGMAVDAIGQRTLDQGRPLPARALEQFVLERQQASRARLLAFQWLARADHQAPERLLPAMLDDPSGPLRRLAIERLLRQARRAEEQASNQPAAETSTASSAKQIYQQALAAARDLNQIRQIIDSLRRLGETIDQVHVLGYLVDWHTIGPFDNTGNLGHAKVYPPEETHDLVGTDKETGTYAGKDQQVSWQAHHSDDPKGRIDLNGIYGKLKGVVAYAWTDFKCASAREAELRWSTPNASKVWVNKRLVAAHNIYHTALSPDQYRAVVRLQPGSNRFLVKLCQDEQTETWTVDWQFQFRVTDRLGGAIHEWESGERRAENRMNPHTSFQRIQRVLIWLTLPLLVPLLTGADWRQFRGSDNRAVAPDQALPVSWNLDHLDRESAQPRPSNIWRAELPGRGPASPIVVDGRVIATASSGAAQNQLHLLSFNARTGQRMWQRKFWATGRTLCHPTSAVAAPTPASDGKRIFAYYSSNDLVCFDLDGNPLWYRSLARDYPRVGNDTGMSSSPLVIGKTVIVQVESQGNSFAVGIDVETGLNRWRIPRQSVENWSSPVLYRSAQGQSGLGQGRGGGYDMALLQSPWGLTLLDPNSGRVEWQKKLSCASIPSTVVAENILYVPATGMTTLRVADSAGEAPEVLWRENRLTTDASSPVVHQGKLYTVNSAGVLGCADAASGRILWRLRLKGRFWATPVMNGAHLYLVNSDGLVQVVKAVGTRGTLIGSCELDEPIQATPAVANGVLYFRSDRHLWGISGPPKS